MKTLIALAIALAATSASAANTSFGKSGGIVACAGYEGGFLDENQATTVEQTNVKVSCQKPLADGSAVCTLSTPSGSAKYAVVKNPVTANSYVGHQTRKRYQMRLLGCKLDGRCASLQFWDAVVQQGMMCIDLKLLK